MKRQEGGRSVDGKEGPGQLVSVITPAFNAGASLQRVVESVASQTIGPCEHIIIDDGSEDDTRAILESLEVEFPHIRTASQPRRGAGRARNSGIEAARGRYIAFLDADDEWRPEKLESQVRFMEETGATFTYGDYLRVRGAGGGSHRVRTPDALTYEDFLKGCPIGCLTAAYNQEALGKVYMPEVRRGHDWGLWLALTRRGGVGRRYPGVHAVYHVRAGSLSSRKLGKAVDIYRVYRFQEGFGRLRSLGLLLRHSLSKL